MGLKVIGARKYFKVWDINWHLPPELGAPFAKNDDKLTVLAHDIAQKLEKEAQYAGQIKVTVIREVRATDTTKAR